MEFLGPIFFYILAISLLISTVFIIFSRRIVSSLIWGMVAFSAVAGLYFCLNATFNAAVQIAVFVGVLPVLMFATIGVTPQKNESEPWLSFSPRAFLGIISLVVILISVLWALVDNYLERILDIISGGYLLSRSLSTVYTIGERIFSNYIVSFEIVSIIIFVLVVGIGMVGVFKRSGEK